MRVGFDSTEPTWFDYQHNNNDSHLTACDVIPERWSAWNRPSGAMQINRGLIDGLAKSQKTALNVIPAKAGIQ
jgi:hypothetical protein